VIDADMQSLTSAVNVDPGAKISTPMKFDMPTIPALIVLWILLGFLFYTFSSCRTTQALRLWPLAAGCIPAAPAQPQTDP
jgi:hypothetical protein